MAGITALGGRAVAVQGDLTLPETPSLLVEAVGEALGPIDILAANAGTAPRQTLDEIELDDWNRVVDVNLRAPFLLAQRVLPGMGDRGYGRILFVSSLAAFTGGIVGAHYAAAKSGLHGLTHFLAARFAAHGVTVNTIAPALVEDTGMLPGSPDELRSIVPVGRLGRSAEVADLAVAMLSNAYLTSKVIGLDGGISAVALRLGPGVPGPYQARWSGSATAVATGVQAVVHEACERGLVPGVEEIRVT